MIPTFTFLAQRTAFSPPDFSFQTHQATCLFGRLSLPHLRTLMEPVDWFEGSTIQEVRIACASQSDTGHLVESVVVRRAYPSPNGKEPHGSTGSCSRSG